MVIFGAEDQIYDAQAAVERYRQNVPGVQTQLIPGAGHSPNVETPERGRAADPLLSGAATRRPEAGEEAAGREAGEQGEQESSLSKRKGPISRTLSENKVALVPLRGPYSSGHRSQAGAVTVCARCGTLRLGKAGSPACHGGTHRFAPGKRNGPVSRAVPLN